MVNNKRKGAQPNKKKQIPGKQVRRQTRVVQKKAFVSECVRDFTHALADPWHADPCCYPDSHARRSYKTRLRQRGQFVIGTAGVGFVSFSSACFSGSTSVAITEATFAGTTFDNVAVSGVTGINAGAPFPASAGFSARPVTTSLRISYTGTELNRGGMIYGTGGIGVGTIPLAGNSASALGMFESTIISRPDANRSWIGVTRKPTSGERLYLTGELPANWDLSAGFLVTGVPGETYAYDYASMVEYCPTDVTSITPGMTDSYSSPEHTAQVVTLFNNSKNVIMNAGTKKASFVEEASQALDNVPDIISTVSKYVDLGMKAVNMMSLVL